jgi:two-component system, NtrC family, sensor kinase
VTTDLDANLPPVTGDHNQIQQCVINLIFNAIDAMPAGGKLSLQSAGNAASKVVEIRVQDTGSGISKEDLPYIFDPFFTTKKEGKGIGLGLSTVYGIMERHKGSIEVSTQPGKGSVFTLKLPVSG